MNARNLKNVIPFEVGIGKQDKTSCHFYRKNMNMNGIVNRVKHGACLSHNFSNKESYILSELNTSEFESTNLVFIGFKDSKHPIEEVYYALNFKPSLAFSTQETRPGRFSYILAYAVESTITDRFEYFSTLNIFLNVILDVRYRGWYEFLDPASLDVTYASSPYSEPKDFFKNHGGWYTNYFFDRVIKFFESYKGYMGSLLENSSIPGYTYNKDFIDINFKYNSSFFNTNNYDYDTKYNNIKKLICLSENGISVPIELLKKVEKTLSYSEFRPLLTNENELEHKEGYIYTNVENMEIYKMKTLYLKRGNINEKTRNKTLALYACTLKRMKEDISLVYFSACLYWLNNKFSEEIRMRPQRLIELAIDRFWDDTTEGKLSTKVKFVLNPAYKYLSTEEKRTALNQIRISQRNLKLAKAIDLNQRIKGNNEKETGYKKSTIYKYIKENNFKIKTNYDRFKDELNSGLYSNLSSAVIQVEISKKLNLTTRTIRRYISRYQEENIKKRLDVSMITVA